MSKGVSEVSAAEHASEASRVEQAQQVSGASKRANGRASGPVLASVFLVDLTHSAFYLCLSRRRALVILPFASTPFSSLPLIQFFQNFGKFQS